MKSNEIRSIGIVTVLYNSSPVLYDFIDSLEKQSFTDFTLYMIDNNSTDNTVNVAKELLNKSFLNAVLIEESTNWGVAKGNNIGIKRAMLDRCSYVLLSNNDVVFGERTLETLYNFINDTDSTIAVPKIYFYNTDNILWCAGGYFSWLRGSSMHIGYKKADGPVYDEIKKITYCPTCFMLIKSEVFSRIGLMDELYFVYADDADFCWRATIKGNEKMIYVPQSTVYHKESFSTGGVLSDFGLYYVNRNRIYFALKHFSVVHNIYYFIYCFFIHFLLKDMWCLNIHQIKILFTAFNDGLKLFVKSRNHDNSK